MPIAIRLAGVILAGAILPSLPAGAVEPAASESAEAVIRALVQANADRDLETMAGYYAHDADVVGYTIGGRKYIGWDAFADEMRQEFGAVTRLEIPITELHVWTSGTIAWFSMELDYIRHVAGQPYPTRLPLRETGVLQQRNGQWILVSWHESARAQHLTAIWTDPPGVQAPHLVRAATAEQPDVSGRWEIQEEDKSYVATLDHNGNGTYTHQGGRITTTMLADRKWQGTWQQPGNDREGGFDLLLSEDGNEARGIWWYTRVGDRKNIPPRQHGGTYLWKRTADGGRSPEGDLR